MTRTVGLTVGATALYVAHGKFTTPGIFGPYDDPDLCSAVLDRIACYGIMFDEEEHLVQASGSGSQEDSAAAE